MMRLFRRVWPVLFLAVAAGPLAAQTMSSASFQITPYEEDGGGNTVDATPGIAGITDEAAAPTLFSWHAVGQGPVSNQVNSASFITHQGLAFKMFADIPNFVSVTRCTNGAGTDVTQYTIGTSTIFVTVNDADENANPALAESITVTLTDGATGDTETLTLTETGVNTGVFRNGAGFPSAAGAANPGDNILQTANGSTFTASYVDNDDPTDASNDTALLLPASSASATAFTDAVGAGVAQYILGAGDIFITVTDADENASSVAVETVFITLTDAVTGDSETVTLTETGADTGVFRNVVGVPSSAGAAIPGDGTLQTSLGNTISAGYVDNDTPGDTSSDTALIVSTATASTTSFTNNAGAPAATYVIAAGNIFVTVTDGDENTSAATVQSVGVVVSDAATGDSVAIALTETGANTGVFRNTAGLNSALGAAAPDAILQTASGSTITALYTDNDDGADTSSDTAVMTLAEGAGTTAFTDAAGANLTTYALGAGDVFITVTDADQNTDFSTLQTVTADVTDAVTADSETVTLTETGANTGVFRNAGGLPSAAAATSINDGTLQTGIGNTITATYVDPGTPGDTSSDTATITAVPGLLTLAVGPSSPGDTSETASALDVEMLQISLTAGAPGTDDVRVTSVTLTASGTGADPTALSARLWRDVNGNGLLESTIDFAISAAGAYTADDGTLAFSGLTEVIPAGTSARWLVMYDFNGSAAVGDTFRATVASNASVAAVGVNLGGPIVPAGPAPYAGGLKTIVAAGSGGTLTVLVGGANPLATNQANSALDVEVLQLTLVASSGGTVTVTGITFTAAGTGPDNTVLTAAQLFRDANSNGLLDAGDVQVGANSTYGADNGTVSFAASIPVAAGTGVSFLLVYDFNGTAAAGTTFLASLAANGDVATVSTVTGAPVASNPVTIQTAGPGTPGSLTLTAGPQNPVNQTTLSNSTDVEMMQVALTASSLEAVTVTSVRFRASGSGDDAAGCTNVRLVRDANANGIFDAGEVVLGAAGIWNADEGQFSLSGLTETVPANGTILWLLVQGFNGTPTNGQTFRGAIGLNSDVAAVGVASGSSVVPGGAPVTGATMTIVVSGGGSSSSGGSSSGGSSSGGSSGSGGSGGVSGGGSSRGGGGGPKNVLCFADEIAASPLFTPAALWTLLLASAAFVFLHLRSTRR